MIINLIGGRYDGATTTVDDSQLIGCKELWVDNDDWYLQKYKYVGNGRAYYMKGDKVIHMDSNVEKHALLFLWWESLKLVLTKLFS